MVYICKKTAKRFFGHDTGTDMSPKAWALVTAEYYDLVSLDATMGKRIPRCYHMGVPDVEVMFQKLIDFGCIDRRTVKVYQPFQPQR